MRLCLCLLPLLLWGCTEPPPPLPTYQVQEQPFAIEVPTFGELEAQTATLITVPGSQSVTLAWLAEENRAVSEGELIARFEPDKLRQDSRTQELEMALIAEDIRKREAATTQQQTDVGAEQQLVIEEFAFVDRFNIQDLRLYSQLEIIDNVQNREFLGAKNRFLDWKEGSVSLQAQSALDVLTIKRDDHQRRFQQYQQALENLEIRAPYDGFLVHDKNWRGETPQIGQTLFPGSTIAKLPDLSQIQAKLYVQANEALDLSSGLPLRLTLSAAPERKLTGSITKVSKFPRSIERRNPVKYYELSASLSDSQHPLLQPGRKVRGTIQVQPATTQLQVPLQSLWHEQGQAYVWLKRGSGFARQAVVTGPKNLHFVVIEEGLNKGDEVALSPPGDSA